MPPESQNPDHMDQLKSYHMDQPQGQSLRPPPGAGPARAAGSPQRAGRTSRMAQEIGLAPA
eukprot:1207588-Prymnesium_polylepis.2